jgi:outer membrane protein assembly factor BamB
MTRLAALCILFLTVTFTGCQAPPDLLSNLIVQPTVATDLGYGIAWQSSLGLPEGQRVLFAEVLGDRIVVLETENILSCMRTDNGQVLWRNPIGRRGERFGKPTRHGDRLVISSARRLHTFSIDHGQALSITDLSTEAATPVTLSGTTAIFGSPDGTAFAHDVERGYYLWSFQTGASIEASPVMAGPSLVVTNTLGRVLIFNPASGTLIWAQKTYGRISANPAATDRTIYVASEDQSLYAFFRQTGKLAWRQFTNTPLTRSPYAIPSLVIQPIHGIGLQAFDENTGDKKWVRSDLLDARLFMFKNNQIWAHHKGEILHLDPLTGQTIRSIQVPGVQVVVPESAAGGDLYALHLSGKIMKLTPR